MTEGREHLTPFAHSASNRCFGCGPANPAGLHLEFLLAPDGSVVSLPVVRQTTSTAIPATCMAESSPHCWMRR